MEKEDNNLLVIHININPIQATQLVKRVRKFFIFYNAINTIILIIDLMIDQVKYQHQKSEYTHVSGNLTHFRISMLSNIFKMICECKKQVQT